MGIVLTGAVAAETVSVKDLGGVARNIPEKKPRATVLFFITTDCPIANSYAPEIKRICADYEREKIAFYLVYSDPSISLKATQKHIKDFGYRCPAIRDANHALVKKVKATVTPEAVVLSPDDKLLYRGRIDDRYLDFGKKRTHPTTRDLRDALDAIVRDQPVPNPSTKAVGCFIPVEN
jgi:hypothetical protein